MKIGYLDPNSIEVDEETKIKTAWFVDQNGGELGFVEFDQTENVPETYEFDTYGHEFEVNEER